MSADVETEAKLLPAAYAYMYYVQYFFLLIGIILVSDLLISLILGLFDLLSGRDWTVLGARELTSTLGATAAMILAGMAHHYRRSLRTQIDSWTRFSFNEPIAVEVPVETSKGQFVNCAFRVDMEFWFENEEAAAELRAVEDRLIATLQAMLEEASQDPVARRSKVHFEDWIEERFRLPKLMRIDVKSTDFRPIYATAPARSPELAIQPNR